MADRHLIIDPAPEGWQDLELADLCDRVQESVQPVVGGSTPYVGLEHLTPGFPSLLGHGVEGDVTSSKAGFRKGDILFGKLRPYLRKGAQPDFDGVCSTDILVFRAKDPGTPDYLKYLVHSDQFIERAKATTSGVQHPRTSWSSLREFKVTVPTRAEQQRIAQVLSTVQAAIEQQERLIRTTTELKQALMQKLFTEGLRGEAQKETEIGLVPESWEVVYCETLCDLITVGIVVKPVQYYVPEGVPALRSQNVRVNRMQREPMVYISPAANEGPVSKSRLKAGDVLVVRTGANVGMSCVLPDDYDGCNCIDLLILRPNTKAMTGSFLSRFINTEAAVAQVGAGKIGLAQPHFNVGTIRRMLVPKPSLAEQREIVEALEAVDRKTEAAESKRNTLQALFRTLLHELMTGKVRVPKEVTYYTSVRA